MIDPDYLIAKAESLLGLASRVADPELAREFAALAHELMAKAVELDTAREKSRSAPLCSSSRNRRT